MGKPVVIGGHDILAVERFRDETRHMIVYDVLETEPPYGEYRQAREDMKELLTAKANIDRILGKETQERQAQKEKETDQR